MKLQEINVAIPELDGEDWRYVSGTNNRYLISNMGRLLALYWKGSQQPKIMSPAKCKRKGYLKTVIIRDGKNRNVSIHRLVCNAFLPNPENKPQINHKNYVTDDNRLENLEWCTAKENMKHAYLNGRLKPPVCTDHVQGSRVGTSKLNEQQVREIRAKFKRRVYTRQMLGDEYGVSPLTIKDVILRRWKHVE